MRWLRPHLRRTSLPTPLDEEDAAELGTAVQLGKLEGVAEGAALEGAALEGAALEGAILEGAELAVDQVMLEGVAEGAALEGAAVEGALEGAEMSSSPFFPSSATVHGGGGPTGSGGAGGSGGTKTKRLM